MTNKLLNRRVAIAGGVAAVVVVGAGGFAATRFVDFAAIGPKGPDAEAEEYVKLLAEVHEDYVNGRVVEHEGWVLSQHEFDTLASRQRKTPGTATG